jgi:L-iditol 2-dehydrogenase
MKRVVIPGPGEVAVANRALPGDSSDHVVVAVGACGLCTLEQRAYRGSIGVKYPFAGGHEVGGIVQSAPSGDLSPGTTVAVSLLPRCGRCPACLLGRDNLCVYLSEFNKTTNGPGGLSEYVTAAPQDVVPVGPDRSVAEAAVVEPLACVLNSLRIASVVAGTRLAIIGNGFMGVLHARAAQAAGALPTLFETTACPAGLENAWNGPRRRLETQLAVLSRRDPIRGEHEFDAAILIRGVVESLPLAAQLVRPGGTVSVFASQPSDEDIALPSQIVRKKELRLTAAASHRREDFHNAASLVRDGDVVVTDLVHRCFVLDEMAAAFDYSVGHDTGRIMITMGPAGLA